MEIDRIAQALEEFVNSEDWEEAQRIVEENQDLLTDQAQQLLNENIADYRQAEREDVADYLEEHRRLLERSRGVGIAKAFAEAEAHAQEVLAAREREMAALRPARPTPLQATTWSLLDAASPDEVNRVLSDHPELTQDQQALSYVDDLMQQARAAGADEAQRVLREYHELLRSFFELPPLMRALQEFISVPNWDESRQVLQRHPELMTDEARDVLEGLIDEAHRQNDVATAHALESYWQVLTRSREVGPEQAVAEVMQQPELPVRP